MKKLMKRLWGDTFFNIKTKKWSEGAGAEGAVRGFNQFVLDPIYKVKRLTNELSVCLDKIM